MLKTCCLALITFYQRCISPFLPPSCRFQPSCSQFAKEAIAVHGFKGLVLSFRRLLSCHPFHRGGWDPVPPLNPPSTESLPHV